MTIFELLLFIALVGLGAWLLVKLVPMPGEIRSVLIGVAVIIVVLVALQQFGVLGVFDRPVPRF